MAGGGRNISKLYKHLHVFFSMALLRHPVGLHTLCYKIRLPGQKAILLMDGHSSQESLDAIEMAAKEDVELHALSNHLMFFLVRRKAGMLLDSFVSQGQHGCC